MCTHFRPPNSRIVQDMRGLHGVAPPEGDWPPETYPGYLAPIITRGEAGTGARCQLARLGLVPRWSRDARHAAEMGRRTYNARSETVAGKPSYRSPWREGRLALVPMIEFFEPCWESGKAVRWGIAPPGGEPFAVAALHERWTDHESGEQVDSFTLLTVNADAHPFMRRMHRPGDEKRSLVVVPPDRYLDWLHATPPQALAMLRPESIGALAGAPAPRRADPQGSLL
jgi:putative SOS response-associated peptidase YedK